MTGRERFLAILDYEQPDEPLLMQWMGFSEATVRRWRQEGMSGNPHDYFGLGRVQSLPVTVFPYPVREDILLEQGETYPLECQSGADPVKFRNRYGQTVQLVGGIDKRSLIQGQEATAAEVDYKLSNLAAESGFLPGIDHAVPPEVSLETFRFNVGYLRDTWAKLL